MGYSNEIKEYMSCGMTREEAEYAHMMDMHDNEDFDIDHYRQEETED